MAPETRSKGSALASTPESALVLPRVYRSNRTSEQIRFPGRRKVVKKYGRHDTTRSPRQRTLTQIGYAVPPLSDLHEPDAPDQDLEADCLGDGQEGKLAAHRRNKRRKTRREALGTATAMTASFHTQTLTQLVSRQSDAWSHEDEVFGFDATIRDSEDEYSLASPEAQSKKPAVAQCREEETLTPRKQRIDGLGMTSRQTMSTPNAMRTEIPSSQPSPFTPLLLLDRYHSPLGRQRSSPLSNKGASQAITIGNPDVSLALRDPSYRATEDIRIPYTLNRASRRVIADSFSTVRSASRNQSPLRVLRSLEIARPSIHQGDSDTYGIVNDADVLSSDGGPSGLVSLIGSMLGGQNRDRKDSCTSEEIPDSDEEEEVLSVPFGLPQIAVATTQQAGVAAGAPVIDTIRSPLSSPLSSSPTPEPASPTPLPQRRDILSAGSGLLRLNEADATASQLSGSSSSSIYSRQRRLDGLRLPRSTVHSPTSQDEGLETVAPLSLDQPLQENESSNSSCPISRRQIPSNISQHASSQPTGTQQPYSEALESQRVPLDVIRSLGPQTDRSDIIISIRPEQIRKIVSGAKNHEFRNYKIPHTVRRFWFYATRPVCELQYVAVVAAGFRQPGEIDSSSGIGNAEFNAGRLDAKFAYKLVQVYELNNPVPLDVMKRNGWVDGPPQRYTYVPPAVVGALLGNLRCALFEDECEIGTRDDENEWQKGKGRNEEPSVSQEVEAQLLSDIAETQLSGKHQSQTLSRSREPPTVMETPGVTSIDGQPSVPSLSADPPQIKKPSSVQLPPHSYLIEQIVKDGTNCSVRSLGEPGVILRSQATVATTPLTQEVSRKGPMTEAMDTTGSQMLGASSPTEHMATILRPTLDQEASSVPSAKNELAEKGDANAGGSDDMEQGSGSPGSDQAWLLQQATHGSQRLKRRRQGPPLQTALTSSTHSTQIVLPDSLYEEVRQAPPAVILDSEDSEGDW